MAFEKNKTETSQPKLMATYEFDNRVFCALLAAVLGACGGGGVL